MIIIILVIVVIVVIVVGMFGSFHCDIDIFQGDSGGPLVARTDGKWTVHGITSFGTGCAEPKHPGVYTRVWKFMDWIKVQTNGTAIKYTTHHVYLLHGSNFCDLYTKRS